MKIVKILFFSLVTTMSFGQSYETMPTAIKQKMDENKVEGLPALSGVSTKLSVTVENLSVEDAVILTNLLEADSRIQTFHIASDRASISVDAVGDLTIKDIKSHIINTNASIATYTQEYTLSGN